MVIPHLAGTAEDVEALSIWKLVFYLSCLERKMEDVEMEEKDNTTFALVS